MKLGQVIKSSIIITALSLIYVHMQMHIIDLAYAGKTKEEKIRQLIEANGNVTYSILKLKSSENLGVKMLAEDSDMQFIEPGNIVELPMDRIGVDGNTAMQQVDDDSALQSLLSFWPFGAQAEARE